MSLRIMNGCIAIITGEKLPIESESPRITQWLTQQRRRHLKCFTWEEAELFSSMPAPPEQTAAGTEPVVQSGPLQLAPVAKLNSFQKNSERFQDSASIGTGFFRDILLESIKNLYKSLVFFQFQIPDWDPGQRGAAGAEVGEPQPGNWLNYDLDLPHTVTVTTRIILFLARDPFKPSFATLSGWGVDPNCDDVCFFLFCTLAHLLVDKSL